MEVWFEVKKENVIELLERVKNGLPWGDHPDEKYSCLIFWEDGKISITVNEFYELDNGDYECCRYYTDIIANTIDEYNSLTDEKISSKAYNAWCSGAR